MALFESSGVLKERYLRAINQVWIDVDKKPVDPDTFIKDKTITDEFKYLPNVDLHMIREIDYREEMRLINGVRIEDVIGVLYPDGLRQEHGDIGECSVYYGKSLVSIGYSERDKNEAYIAACYCLLTTIPLVKLKKITDECGGHTDVSDGEAISNLKFKYGLYGQVDHVDGQVWFLYVQGDEIVARGLGKTEEEAEMRARMKLVSLVDKGYLDEMIYEKHYSDGDVAYSVDEVFKKFPGMTLEYKESASAEMCASVKIENIRYKGYGQTKMFARRAICSLVLSKIEDLEKEKELKEKGYCTKCGCVVTLKGHLSRCKTVVSIGGDESMQVGHCVFELDLLRIMFELKESIKTDVKVVGKFVDYLKTTEWKARVFKIVVNHWATGHSEKYYAYCFKQYYVHSALFRLSVRWFVVLGIGNLNVGILDDV